MQYLSAKLDIVFRMIFGSEHNTDILIGLLKAILDIGDKIQNVVIKNPFVMRDEPDDKESVLDIKIELDDGHRVDVEIQLKKSPNLVKRLHFYKSKLLTEQLPSGGKYTDLARVSCVAILDKVMYDDSSCHHVFRMYDKKHDIEFSDLEEIHLIEIPKLELDKSNPPLTYWLKFLNASTKEELDMLSQTSEVMNRAVSELTRISSDEQARMKAEAREKWLRDQQDREYGAREEERQKIARNMLKKGYPLPDISEMTGLGESELFRMQ